MNKTQLTLSLILLFILSTVSFFIFKNDASSWRRGNVITKQKLIDKLDVNKVALIKIEQPTATIMLKKEAKKWVIENRNNYPINFETLKNFLLDLSNLDVAQYPRVIKEQYPSLKLVLPQKTKNKKEAGTLLTLMDKAGNPLLTILFGTLHYPPTHNGNYTYTQKPSPDGRYVIVNNNNTPALVTSPNKQVDISPLRWIDNTFFTIPQILSVTSENMDGKINWKISRKDMVSPWSLASIKKTEQVLPRKMMGATSTFSTKLKFDDVKPLTMKLPKEYKTIIIKSLSGIQYTFNIYTTKEYAFLKIIDIKADAKLANVAEIQNKIKNRLFYKNWIFQFPRYRLERVLIQRKQLVRPNTPEL